jgi:hypothetical protein
MYYHVADHETKYCPTLLTKIQDKRNHNNQWIAVENIEEDEKNIKIVTRCGDNTREYGTKKDQD